MLQAAIVEEDVVAQIEVSQVRERRKRVARQARLMQTHLLEARKLLAFDNRVFQWDVGLHRLVRPNVSSAGEPLNGAIVSATSVAGWPCQRRPFK